VAPTKAEIGNRIKKLRLQQKRTLANVADVCQFSISLLSKIENGKILPSVGTLIKITDALGTTINAIIETEKTNMSVYTPTAKAHKNMILTQKGLYIHPYATARKENLIHPMLHVMNKATYIPKVDSHEGQEFIFILKGSLKFMVGVIEYFLNEGDSIYFDAVEAHMGTPLSDIVEYLDIFK
jgi:transcriptional regulator with XRE-family HTH domain